MSPERSSAIRPPRPTLPLPAEKLNDSHADPGFVDVSRSRASSDELSDASSDGRMALGGRPGRRGRRSTGLGRRRDLGRSRRRRTFEVDGWVEGRDGRLSLLVLVRRRHGEVDEEVRVRWCLESKEEETMTERAQWPSETPPLANCSTSFDAGDLTEISYSKALHR